jgi:predicted amidohydrolase
MNTAKTALDAEDLAFFAGLARAHRACVSFGGVQGGYNNLITMNASGQVISTYSKAHLFSMGKEDTAYRSGTRPERFTLNDFCVVPAVCYDLRFPYVLWDEAARADLCVVIACWPAQRAEHWMRLLQARAIENQCYVVGVNRTGQDPLLSYCGNSMIFDPMGKVVLDCRQDEGTFVTAGDVDNSLVAQTRQRLPFLKDRRPNFA